MTPLREMNIKGHMLAAWNEPKKAACTSASKMGISRES
jgi:hypothetical protein